MKKWIKSRIFSSSETQGQSVTSWSADLENFHCTVSVNPTDYPWVSREGVFCALFIIIIIIIIIILIIIYLFTFGILDILNSQYCRPWSQQQSVAHDLNTKHWAEVQPPQSSKCKSSLSQNDLNNFLIITEAFVMI